jgi:hypothetical protein
VATSPSGSRPYNPGVTNGSHLATHSDGIFTLQGAARRCAGRCGSRTWALLRLIW